MAGTAVTEERIGRMASSEKSIVAGEGRGSFSRICRAGASNDFKRVKTDCSVGKEEREKGKNLNKNARDLVSSISLYITITLALNREMRAWL